MARLGDMLVSEGLITKDQLDQALQDKNARGGFLGDILVQKRLLTEEQLVEVLVRQTGSPAIDLGTVEIDPALSRVVSVSLAKRYRCIPVRQNGKILHVAMANPQDDLAIENLSSVAGCTIKTFVAASNALEAAWKKLYGEAALAEAAASGVRARDKAAPAEGRAASKRPLKTLPSLKAVDETISNAVDKITHEEGRTIEAEDAEVVDLEPKAGEPPVVQLVNGILVKAVHMRASDIHIEPQEESIRVRFRIDGVMVPILTLASHIKPVLVSRIKILSRMDIAEKRIPQDGRIKVRLTEAQSIDYRVNVLPSIYGEKVVLRLLGQGSLSHTIEGLGFVGRNLELIREAIRNPYGMILVTGPTGSGKTTTLYTVLKELNKGDVNILTAEDPVEYHLPGITQVNVRPAIGFTFDVALRAFLRQDPNIILVGEIRDYETAAIATKAALTGHLVLSTLHTNDCPSTVVRLVDMGIEPYLVASAVKIVVAQRLVRKVCRNCREEVSLDVAEKADLGQSALAAIEHLYRGKGCDQCNRIGYEGRAPVYEVMAVRSKEMKRVITEGGTEIQVAQVARREGIRTLKDESLRLVNDGLTSLEEALKIIMAE